MVLPDSAVGVSRTLPSRWILHHKKNQKVFVSISDIFEYISQVDNLFSASVSVASRETNLKSTVAKESGWW